LKIIKQKQNAEREGDYGKVAEIRYSKIKDLLGFIRQQVRIKMKITEILFFNKEEVTRERYVG
jgi:hypothetical protein